MIERFAIAIAITTIPLSHKKNSHEDYKGNVLLLNVFKHIHVDQRSDPPLVRRKR